MSNYPRFKTSQYACAVLLIVSSIALVAYQVVHIDDVANGLLYYVAQSFLLAGSIFGLDQKSASSKSTTMKTVINDPTKEIQAFLCICCSKIWKFGGKTVSLQQIND